MSSAIDGSSVSGQTVCVTGAGGFIGSWLVKLLLERGYTVKGAERHPEDPKHSSHLKALKGAEERLLLCKIDLLDYNSLVNAFHGCVGVFHTAAPVTNDPSEVSASVDGTKNVINAAAEVGVRRVVYTSSVGAMHMDPNRSPDTVMDESCWSDLEYCKKTNNLYCYAKATAEHAAWELSKEKGIELLVVVPTLTVGPILQSTLNFSIFQMLRYVRGLKKSYPNAVQGYVDVRDVALAHVLVYENPSASGRYFCLESVIHRDTLVALLKELCPDYPIVARCNDELKPKVKPWKFSNKKLKDLGLHFIPIKQSLYETVKCLQEKGHLPLPENLVPEPHHRSSL